MFISFTRIDWKQLPTHSTLTPTQEATGELQGGYLDRRECLSATKKATAALAHGHIHPRRMTLAGLGVPMNQTRPSGRRSSGNNVTSKRSCCVSRKSLRPSSVTGADTRGARKSSRDSSQKISLREMGRNRRTATQDITSTSTPSTTTTNSGVSRSAAQSSTSWASTMTLSSWTTAKTKKSSQRSRK